jgi:hypothetical protein
LLAVIVRLAAAILSLLVAGAAVPGLAHADGDPASDVLLGQDVFLPYTAISPRIEDDLYSVTTAAQKAGYPVKIALIEGKDDLGSVPQEFEHPESYADFLSDEIGTAVSGVVLVVMPNGFGLAVKAHKLSVAALSGIPIAAGTDGLGTAAIAATEKLAAAAGHPLPSNAASASVTLGAPAASVDFACETLIVLCALAALGVSVAVVARRRRQGDARTATARASR